MNNALIHNENVNAMREQEIPEEIVMKSNLPKTKETKPKDRINFFVQMDHLFEAVAEALILAIPINLYLE